MKPPYQPPEEKPDEFPSVVEALIEFNDPDRPTSAFAQEVVDGRAMRARMWAESAGGHSEVDCQVLPPPPPDVP